MPFGPNMGHNYDIFVAETYIPARGSAPQTPAMYHSVAHIGQQANGFFQRQTLVTQGNIDSQVGDLSLSGGNYTYVYMDDVTYSFSSAVQAAPLGTHGQRATQIDYADGRRRALLYNASAQLRQVIDSAGYGLVLDYGTNGFISAACVYDLAQTYVSSSTTCGGATWKATYTYNTSGRLASVTNMLNQVTTYTYTSGLCVTPPGYTTCRISNDSLSRVTQQTLADGTVWHFNVMQYGDRSTEDYVDVDGQDGGTLTDPLGHQSGYYFTQTSPYSFSDANGSVTQYRYTGSHEFGIFDQPSTAIGSLLVEADFPDGNSYLAEYVDWRNRVTRQTWRAEYGSGLADRVVTYGYGACRGPVWVRDANGNETDNTCASWGGILTEMGPPPATGAARPLTVHTYAQRQAYIKNSSGTLVPSATQIWMPATVTVCQTAAGSSTPTCDGSAPQRTTTYQYGATGTGEALLLKGEAVSDGTTTLRTCYGYDAQRNWISQTAPNANLATCP